MSRSIRHGRCLDLRQPRSAILHHSSSSLDSDHQPTNILSFKVNLVKAKAAADALLIRNEADTAFKKLQAEAFIDPNGLTPLETKLVVWFNDGASITSSASFSDYVTHETFSVALLRKIESNTPPTNRGINASNVPYNYVLLRDTASLFPIQDGASRRVFGRMTKTDFALTGSLSFTNATTAVTGAGTLFTSELVAGDWIKLNSSGVYYKVNSITSNTLLDLIANYDETTASGAATETKLTLSYVVFAAGVEVPHLMGVQDIDFSFAETTDLFNLPMHGLVNSAVFLDG